MTDFVQYLHISCLNDWCVLEQNDCIRKTRAEKNNNKKPSRLHKKFKTMLLGSSTGFQNSVMSHLFPVPCIGSLLKKRADYKLASLCFKSLNGSAPTYLSDLHLYTPSRQIRSTTDTQVFRIPSFHTKSSGSHSLYQAPTTWNQLPVSIRHASSDSSFKSSLKTFLFSQTLSLVPLP